MTGVTTKDVKHLAKLAKLSLSEKELSTLRKQLSEILIYFSKLKKINTHKIEPTSQTTGLTNITRGDKVDSTRTLEKKLAVSEAKKLSNNYFVVERLIEK